MKFSVYLMEQLLAILFFALAAAVCVQLFVNAHLISVESDELNGALLVAQNGAEAFKAAGGDLEYTARLLNDDNITNRSSRPIHISYDENWQLCTDDGARYFMEISEDAADSGNLHNGLITVWSVDNMLLSKPIFDLKVMARGAEL